MGLTAAIERHVGVTPKLERGASGVFDVLVDGAVIFSKHAAGRFPETSEILALLPQKR